MADLSKFPRPVPGTASNTFSLDDGTKEITLVNNFGKTICKLHIRTGDVSIYDRYQALMADFDSIVKPLVNIGLEGDGTASFDKDWATLKKVEGALKQKINELFDMDEADEIFAKRNPFSSIGGQFFVEKVLDTLGVVIARAVEEEARLSQKRTAKYLKDTKAQKLEVTKDAGTTTADT